MCSGVSDLRKQALTCGLDACTTLSDDAGPPRIGLRCCQGNRGCCRNRASATVIGERPETAAGGDHHDQPGPAMTPRRAVLLAAAATISLYVAWITWAPSPQISQGHDFGSAVWGPVRGLLAGFNPYQPGDAGYLEATGQAVFGSLHAPSLLLAGSPFALLEEGTAAVVWAAASAVMMWAAAWILMRPVDARSATATITLGLVLTLSGPGDFMLRLGQVTGPVVLGLALLVRWPHRWAGAVGVALTLVSPQVGIPLSILAVGARQGRAVARGWLLTLALSVPVIVAAAAAAGGVGGFVESIRANLAWTAGDVNATNRIDVAGVWGGGLVVTLVALGVVAGVAVWWRAQDRRVDEVAVLGAAALTVLAAFSMPYSLVLVLAAAWPVLWARRRWGAVEWVAAAMVVVCVGQSLVVLEVVDDLVGLPVVSMWRLLAFVEHLLLVVLVLVALVRLAGGAGSGRAGVRHGVAAAASP